MSLWDTLRPDEKLTERVTKKWIDIGFQAGDPATDFRGSGIQGLDMLLEMLQDPRTKSRALEMYKNSTVQEHWYFYAVTGINITQKFRNAFKNTKDQITRIEIDQLILNQCSNMPKDFFKDPKNLGKLVTRFYFDVFSCFDAKWVQMKPPIMEFNQFLDDIYVKVMRKMETLDLLELAE